jgi:type 1 glutamine amidotransferase
MQTITRPLTLCSLAVALIVAVSFVVPVRGQQSPEGPRKKVLFLTYPGVGGPDTRGHESLPYAEEQTIEFGKTGGFDVTTHGDYTRAGEQDLSFFTPDYLNQFDGLMLMANGVIGLSTDQKKMIVDFVRNGKGFIGVHCAALLMYDYPEFGEMLGAYYVRSITPGIGGGSGSTSAEGRAAPRIPPNQKRFGVLKVEDNTHPATRMLGPSWPIVEEFYLYGMRAWSEEDPTFNVSSPGGFKPPIAFSRDRVNVLLSLDTERTNVEGLRRVVKGGDYPQSWWRNYGQGRSFYTSLGHVTESWTHDAVFRAHLTGGIRWALGLEN